MKTGRINIKFKIMLQTVFLKPFLVLLVLAAVLYLSCEGDPNVTDPGDENFPDSNLSFTTHIQPIFFDYCSANGACHQTAIQAGGLDLESDLPTFIGNSGQVVIPNRKDLSLLYELLYQQVGTISRMPQDRGSLSDAKIKAIGTWIDEGANTAN